MKILATEIILFLHHFLWPRFDAVLQSSFLGVIKSLCGLGLDGRHGCPKLIMVLFYPPKTGNTDIAQSTLKPLLCIHLQIL